MAYSGRFKPKNPRKYVGNAANIIYRSMWEARYMKFLDAREDVISWGSETVTVPYYDPVKQKRRTYFTDFYVHFIDKKGTHCEWIVEIKPNVQTKEPKKFKGTWRNGKPKGKGSRRYLREVATYATNMAKWEAAQAYCDAKGYEFKILTEKDLGIYG